MGARIIVGELISTVADLKSGDTSSDPTLASPASNSSWRPTADTVRLLVGVADLSQIGFVGTVAMVSALPIGAGPGLARAAVAGLAVAALASVIRRGLRVRDAARLEAPLHSALRGVAALLLALGGVSAAAWALLASDVPEINSASYLTLLAGWAATSSAVGTALRLAAVRFAASHPGGALGLAVVGSPDRVQALVRLLTGSGDCGIDAGRGWRVLATVSDDDLAGMARVRALAQAGRLDVVALAIPPHESERLRSACDGLADTRARVCLGLDPAILEHALPFGAGPGRGLLLDLMPDSIGGWRGIAKRGLDLGVTLAALPLIAPVMLLAAAAVKFDSRGPVFFSQWRFGLGSQPARVWKFRSMYVDRGDATGGARTVARDPRVTRVGRLLRRSSIDELPQLLNVLRGELSLVGPRPHTPHMKVEGSYYFEVVARYRARHRIKPGITGWAQVNGSRGEVDTLEKARRRVELDLWYINNWSLALDLRILLRTALGGFASPKAD